MIQRTLLITAALLSLSCAAQADDVIRCGGSLVRAGMIAPEVIAKCGEPDSKQVESVPIRVRRANGSSGVIGAAQIERWTYDRGTGQFPALLTFEEGKLKSVELLTGR
ncbi:MAG TPA: DUF2845 domain-containing protein [Gammaproteobacteria bacterium]|nr:DUF2845 domain-containing protein [Gammaproteobacteria bacterium]